MGRAPRRSAVGLVVAAIDGRRVLTRLVGGALRMVIAHGYDGKAARQSRLRHNLNFAKRTQLAAKEAAWPEASIR